MPSKKTSGLNQYLQSTAGRQQAKILTITPGNGKAVKLGTFKTNEPHPEFSVSFVPNVKEDMGISEERLKVPGGHTYALVYQFQNFSQKTCKVTVRQK